MEENDFCRPPVNRRPIQQCGRSRQASGTHAGSARSNRFHAARAADRIGLERGPNEVSSKAAVYILGPKGYEKIREGTNGFSCLIERSFKGTTQTSSAPACFDAEGSRTIMLAYLHREELRAEGKSEEEIKDDVAKGYKDGRFKVPGPGFLYMMSNENYVYNSESKKSGFVPPHLMFYAPYKTAKDVGYESISPTMVPYLTGSGVGPESLLVVGVEKPTQDGSSDDSHKH
jgi:hypothetical protein